jgi:hypothetical protein
VAGVYNGGFFPGCSHQPVSHFLQRLHRGREANALHRLPGDVGEALQGECQVRSPARLHDGMDFVDDYRANRPQHVAAALGSEQQVQ